MQLWRAGTPFLALVDRNQLPVNGHHTATRPVKVYHRALTSLEKMKNAEYGRDYLALNTLMIFELGVQNIGTSLAEHIVLDVTLAPIRGFRCNLWDGRSLEEQRGRLSNNTIRSEYKSRYPESARLDGPDQVTLRFRLERVPIGATEYIPPLFVLGTLENERVCFSLKYMIAGSVGSSAGGQCDYEIEFNDVADVGDKGMQEDEAALKRYGGPIIWRNMFLGP